MHLIGERDPWEDDRVAVTNDEEGNTKGIIVGLCVTTPSKTNKNSGLPKPTPVKNR
jgi:hypothetical protein